jgi:hypothetical protein
MGLLILYSYYMMMKKAVREDYLTALIGLIDQVDLSVKVTSASVLQDMG